MGNPVRLVDPDGRDPNNKDARKAARKEKRRKRRNARAEKKWNKHIGSPLKSYYKVGRKERLFDPENMASVEAYLRPFANDLQRKYHKRRWFRWFGENIEKPALAGSATADKKIRNKVRHDVTIQLFSKVTVLNEAYGEGFGMYSVSMPAGLDEVQVSSGAFKISFDAQTHPDKISLGDVSLVLGEAVGQRDVQLQIPFSDAGGGLSITIQPQGQETITPSFWSLQIDYFYLNIRPMIYSGEYNPP